MAEKIVKDSQGLAKDLVNDCISRYGVSAWLDNMGYPRLAHTVMDEDRFPPAQPWIPCSERLPEHAGVYLVTTIVAVDKYVITSWYSTKGGWICEDRPEAWMPLPEPYREDEQ